MPSKRDPSVWSLAARSMREAFDDSFAHARHQETEGIVDVLLIRLDGALQAILLNEVTKLQPINWITPLPGPVPALLGVAGFQGDVLPVYDLRLLLGHGTAQPPRWLVAARSLPVALAFDAFEVHVRCAASDIHRQADSVVAQSVVHTPQGIQPLIDMAHVLATIERVASSGADKQEQ